MLVSDSTHMPPTGRMTPSATALRTRSNRPGWVSLSQAYCCADEAANTKSGWRSLRSSTLANVRATFRTVSRVGHSQAQSMWA